jgi:hypothetical protein
VVAVPFALGNILGASQSNRASQRLGRTVLVVGTALVAVGLTWLWLLLRNVDDATGLTNWDLAVPLVLAGIGSGLFIAPNAQFIVATVDRSEAGSAAGVISVMQRVGSAIGIAVIGSVLFGSLTITSPDPAAVGRAFVDAAANAMAVSALFALAAFVLVFVLPKRAAAVAAPTA